MSIITNVYPLRLWLRSLDQRLSGQDGLRHVRGGCDLSLRTPHHIVVTARVWCRREMIFLREELIAEGLQPLLFFQLEFRRQE
jgi:hypothetical protein